MKIKQLSVIYVLPLITILGCTALGSKSWYQDYSRTNLMKQATFDLNCTESKLKDRPLSGYMTIGVSGCGKQATYKYIDRVGWVANTASRR